MIAALSSSPERTLYHQSSRDRLGALRKARGFSLLPSSTLQQVIGASSTRHFARGSFVFLQGEPIASIHVLLEGRIKMVRETEEGRAVIMRLIEPGDLFGIVGQGNSSSYRNSALTQTNATVLAIPRRVFGELMSTNGAFATTILVELSMRLGDAEARIQDLQTEHAACRTARVLLKLFDAAKGGSGQAHPTLPLSRQDLADLCGTNLSTASRTLSEWEQHGIVDAGRERVKLLRPRALATIAAGRA